MEGGLGWEGRDVLLSVPQPRAQSNRGKIKKCIRMVLDFYLLLQRAHGEPWDSLLSPGLRCTGTSQPAQTMAPVSLLRPDAISDQALLEAPLDICQCRRSAPLSHDSICR